jgi:hypothetical protein
VTEAPGPAGAGETCSGPGLGASAEVTIGVTLGAGLGTDESRNEAGGFGVAIGATRVPCHAGAPVLDAVTEVRVDQVTFLTWDSDLDPVEPTVGLELLPKRSTPPAGRGQRAWVYPAHPP